MTARKNLKEESKMQVKPYFTHYTSRTINCLITPKSIEIKGRPIECVRPGQEEAGVPVEVQLCCPTHTQESESRIKYLVNEHSYFKVARPPLIFKCIDPLSSFNKTSHHPVLGPLPSLQ
ncbi:hypothetical protein HS088_TW09G00330 [Tripterygium wilfordii]|uniref:Uncharacterized protein n=1 Tax=Tripterygium wilfordii TaxID=458696 RepID=A0A7J7D8A3_TRIWF|nr:hypothetical protein HS088_TW09G00330 [Tripterygium wilfordii]